MELKKGYKQTEVGVIPEDWEVKKLGEFVKITSGESPSRFMFSDDGTPYFKVEQLNNGNKYLFDTPYHSEFRSTVPKGSLIFPKRGASILLNKIRILVEDSFMDTNLMTLTLSEGVDNEFMFYALLHKELWRIADTTSIPQINNKHIIPFQIPLPPTKAEQTAIATALSDADVMIQSLEKLIAKKRLLKQGAMQELLKPKEGWMVKKLGEIFSITAGGDLRKDEFSSVNDERYCYPIYSNALTNAGLYGYCSSYDLHGNCITVTARGTVGFANSRDHKFSAIGRLLILKPIEKLNCVFIAEYINLKIEFANESTGVPQLTAPQISKYEVVIPDYTEQTRIATILADMDAEISAIETNLAKYKLIKQGMMQELLTGRTRLV